MFVAIGLGRSNQLGIAGGDKKNVDDAISFIADLRQASDLAELPIGRRVVVVGGGMTAIDAGVQAKLLGAEEVTIVYRRGKDRMSASEYEQDLATSKGVRLIFNAQPARTNGNGSVAKIEFAYTQDGAEGLEPTGETFTLAADQVFRAIGQKITGAPDALDLEGGKIKVTGAGRTSVPGVWAGGDCATGGDDLTVTAVAEGRDAAEDICGSL